MLTMTYQLNIQNLEICLFKPIGEDRKIRESGQYVAPQSGRDSQQLPVWMPQHKHVLYPLYQMAG